MLVDDCPCGWELRTVGRKTPLESMIQCYSGVQRVVQSLQNKAKVPTAAFPGAICKNLSGIFKMSQTELK